MQNSIHKAQKDFSKLALDLSDVHKHGVRSDSSDLLQIIAKLECKVKEMQTALEIKDSAMEKLHNINEKLRHEIRNKETMRMSQVELLALRNLELEKELYLLRESKQTA